MIVIYICNFSPLMKITKRHGRVELLEKQDRAIREPAVTLFYERFLKNCGIQANEMFASCFLT